MAAEGLGQVVSWYICSIVAIGFLLARLIARWQRLAALFIEDYLLCLAGCCLLGDLIIQHYMWTLGLAEPQDKVTLDGFVNMMKMIIPGSTLYVTSLWLIKLALVIFYKKIAAPGTKMQMAYNITLVFLILSWLAIFFDIMFQCFPHDKRWAMNPDYACDPHQSEINFWLTVLLNIFTDVVLICLPITMVSQLQMKLKQKLGVAAIFALGIFVVIASIIRAYFSHNGAQMITCTVSMVEASVAIVAACLPPLRNFILGHSTTNPSSYGKHYELSYINRKSQRNRAPTSHVAAPGGAVVASHMSAHHHKSSPSNDSEDELVFKQQYGLGPNHKLGGAMSTVRSAAGSSLSEDDEATANAAGHNVFNHPSQRHHRAVIEGGSGVRTNGRNSPVDVGTRSMSPLATSPPLPGAGGIMVSTTIEMDKSQAYTYTSGEGRR